MTKPTRKSSFTQVSGTAGTQARKQARRDAQEAAHKRNRDAGITLWQQAEMKRAARRAPLREQWLRRHRDDALGTLNVKVGS